MVLFGVTGGKLGRIFSLALLLLVTARVSRQQGTVGVSLRYRGETLPSDSFVDLDDVLNIGSNGPFPTNRNPGSGDVQGAALECITDLVDCCGTEPDTPQEIMRTQRGNWYFPDGTNVELDSGSSRFLVNRGPNEVINEQQFNGSVRLFRRFSGIPERGHFRCELPNAADPSVNQVLYVNILQFGFRFDVDHVTFSPSTGSTATTAGQRDYSLNCSATLFELSNINPRSDVPSPNFQWSFDGSTSLPSGVTAMPTVMSSRNDSSETYSSILQFSPLSQAYAGMYTCRLGPARLVNSVMVTVDTPSITVSVTPNLNTPLMVGQTDNTLNCGVSGADNLDPTTTYRWTRDGGREVSRSSTLPLSPVGLSDAGNYTCHATVNSNLLTNDVIRTANQIVMVQVPALPSVTVSSSTGSNIILNNSAITINCEVNFGQGVSESELSLLMVEAQLFRNGTPLTLDDPIIMRDSSFIFGSEISSFNDSNVGSYNCTAMVMRAPSSQFLTGTGQGTSPLVTLTIGIPPPPSPPESGGSSQAGAIAGGVIVVIVALAAVVVAVVALLFWFKKRRAPVPYKQAYGRSKPPVAYTRPLRAGDVALTGATKITKPTITKFPSDTNITEGEGVYFRIKVSGEPQPTVTWYHDGEPVRADYAREIESDGSLTIPSTELKHSGVYKAVAANSHGSDEKEVKLTVSEEGISSTDAGAMNGMVSSRPIPVPEFGKYVAELHANSNQPFKDLYQALDTGEGGHSIEYATNRERKPLNRFGNIVVYDDNRIALKPLPDVSDCQRDYINACYVDGYSVPNKFIATQGPLPKTVVDFWRLIWQERPPTIVMVTNVKEGTRIKCQQYWPESGKKDFGPFQVTITDQQIFADYTIRILSVSLGSGGRSHKVTQYHFTAWPDHGVPDYATPILAFHRRVKAQHHPSRGPMVVHCSAGVGRTGTLITIDNVLEQIEKEQVVDIPGAITKIRQRRMKMVQTHDQFTFIHDAILESVTCGDTQIAATNLRMNISKMKKKDNQNQPNGFQYQYKILEQVSPNPDEVHCGGAQSYPERNRSEKFLPADRWRVVLKGEQPDYIHAVNINGYKHKRAFIVAEGPMKSTVRNFWKMIYERNCAVVVMTSSLVEGGQEASAQYWPDSGIGHYGEFAVDLLGEEKLQGFVIRNLSVMDTKTQKAHKVTQFHITCWRPDGHCSNLKSVTDVIEEMTKVQIRSGNKPIVVHCSDTVTRSGMFCAIATTIERCKTEGVVDVFQVVKALRVQKPGAVPTVENYKHIFETALVYLESFDTYANFQNI